MSSEVIKLLREGFHTFELAIVSLLEAEAILLGEAKPPNEIGVYALYFEDTLMYVGEAKGKKGLQDRLISKHISGDDNHTLHKAFLARFPDKNRRKAFIKLNIYAKWIVIECPETVSAVERLLIWSLRPAWNKK
ncbi:hypothetical protein [Alteromonas genovensis]|uniref:hypothetical protein n=1 Tax=Alteromonas genovensis TaxID=471225 RepID=UPI002FE29D30